MVNSTESCQSTALTALIQSLRAVIGAWRG
jgi:hypothetical protein